MWEIKKGRCAMRPIVKNLYKKMFTNECDRLAKVIDNIKEYNDKIAYLDDAIEALQDVCPEERVYLIDRKLKYADEQENLKKRYAKDIAKAKELGICRNV